MCMCVVRVCVIGTHLILVLALAEILRRGQWIILRTENEHLQIQKKIALSEQSPLLIKK